MSEQFDAQKLAWICLKRAQPGGKIPSWIFLNVTADVTPLESGRWKFRMNLFLKRVLEPGEYWETTEEGDRILRTIDQNTGENLVTLFYDVADDQRVPIFEVDVDVASKTAVVILSTDVATLDRNRFELKYDEAIARERLRPKLDAETYAFIFGDEG